MSEDLNARLKEVRADLLDLRNGSVIRAQCLIKDLRKSGMKADAKNLVDLMNKQARSIARINW